MSTPPTKTVYFVRHGQSGGNVASVFQSIKSPLSDNGLNQAMTVAERLRNLDCDLLVSSPVHRAKQTAEIIARKVDKKIVYSDLFVERIKPTEIDGVAYSNEAATAMWRQWEDSLTTQGMKISDGENYDDINERAKKALDFLERRRESKIIVVTHGYFLRAIIAQILIGDNITPDIMKRFQQRATTQNTAVTAIEYRDEFEQSAAWRLITLNDHSHIDI